MNKVILSGRLTRDPEVKETSVKVCRFTVAVDRRTKDGEKAADFINCVAFRQQAEFIGKYFVKGKPIILEGRIQTGSFEDKDGKKVYTTDVICERVEFMLSSKEDKAPEKDAAPDGFSALDEEVPF